VSVPTHRISREAAASMKAAYEKEYALVIQEPSISDAEKEYNRGWRDACDFAAQVADRHAVAKGVVL